MANTNSVTLSTSTISGGYTFTSTSAPLNKIVTGSLSLSCYIKLPGYIGSNGSGQNLMTLYNLSNGVANRVTTSISATNGTLRTSVHNGGNFYGGTSTVITDTDWHYLVITIENNPNATINTYIDGVLINTDSLGAPFNIIDGATFNQLVGRYDMQIDEYAIFDKVIGATEYRDTEISTLDPNVVFLSSFDGVAIEELTTDTFTVIGSPAFNADPAFVANPSLNPTVNTVNSYSYTVLNPLVSIGNAPLVPGLSTETLIYTPYNPNVTMTPATLDFNNTQQAGSSLFTNNIQA